MRVSIIHLTDIHMVSDPGKNWSVIIKVETENSPIV